LSGCKDCAEFEKQLKLQQEEIALLKFELDQFKSDFFKRRKKKESPKQNPPETKQKKKGGLFGHAGWFRETPKKIDRIQQVKLSKCPSCGSKDITECAGVDEHTQQDIILPKIQTTLYSKQRYYCCKCKKIVTGKGINELTKSKIGPFAKAWAVFLKFGVKISDRDVSNILKMTGLEVAPSSIVGFRYQLKREAGEIYKKLLESLKYSKFTHWDETGTKINGDNAWRWKISNKKICVTHTDKRRGQKVVEELFGDKYEGVLISDFLSAYNKIVTKAKQRCLVHILRDLKKVISYWAEEDDEVLLYCKRLKKIFEEAIGLHKEYNSKKWDKKYYRKRDIIITSLSDFAVPNPNKKILNRFAKRLQRHKDELFTFLYIKGIDYHNNHAEQQIRPDVLLRKITFGNRSSEGAKAHDVVMSVLQTAKLNKLDPVGTFKEILLHDRKDPFTEILTASP
jgi:transposase-like protein